MFLKILDAFSQTAEMKIEVDENGDEYEVKRFHIKGRTLNDGRSQCVITRRKRTTPTIKPIEDESRQQQIMFYYTSEPFAEEFNSNDKNPNDKDIPFESLKNKTKESTFAAAVLNNNDSYQEDDEMNMNEDRTNGSDNDNDNETQHLLQQLPQYSSINNGLIVVHSYEPQKLQQKPQQLYALIPLHYSNLDDDGENVSSSSIWSVDDDDDDIDGDDDWDDIPDDLIVNTHDKNKKRPNKTRNKKKTNKKISSSSSSSSSSNNKSKRKNNNKIRRRISTTVKPTLYRKNNRKTVKASNRRKVPISQKNRGNQNVDIDENEDDSYTVTTNQNDDEYDPDINCIIIRKEFVTTTTTTARPFWNIFGRNTNGTSRSSGPFGNRKRLNLKFVA
uniref:Uncharacterized protein n=1 Tax=Glossina brevipalpis TaxID=37001 RepID=A0A1A9X1I1_9MUSC